MVSFRRKLAGVLLTSFLLNDVLYKNIELNERAVQNLIKLKLTSSLTLKELGKLFNVPQIQIAKWVNYSDLEISLVEADWVYGALRTLRSPSIKQISDYIDYKNKIRFSLREIEQALEKLKRLGLAYLTEKGWNFSQRLIEIYSKNDEAFITEIELLDFNLNELKQFFNPDEQDYLMYDQFEIREENHELFTTISSVSFNFKNFKYYLTCRQGEN